MPSISLDTSPGPAAAPDPAAAGAPGPDGAASFASKLGQVMEAGPAVGQNLAAVGLPLKTLALGPTLEVLTASSEPVDSDSLAEFAKAQGLDEEVVAWLFADPAQAAALQSPVVPGLIPGLVPPPSPAAAAAGLEAIVAGDPGLGAALPASAAPSASLTTPWTAMAPVDAGLADGAAPAAPGAPAGPVPGAWLLGNLAASSVAAANLAAAAPDSTAQPPGAAAPDTAQMQSFALAQAMAAGRAAAASPALAEGKAAAQALPAMPEEVVDIAIEPGLEALWDGAPSMPPETTPGSGADTAGTPMNGGSRQQGEAPAPAQAAEARTTPAQRADGYQALAQRLGEAVAQRVISQVEKGNWQVKLMLRPARLGEVEIDLKMRSGELDAAFRAANAVTRDLLTDGLPRLREVLSGAGMDIADLNVGSGLSQQAGGNPTPRPAVQPAAARGGATDTGMAPADAAPAATVRRMGGAQGWDVTV